MKDKIKVEKSVSNFFQGLEGLHGCLGHSRDQRLAVSTLGGPQGEINLSVLDSLYDELKPDERCTDINRYEF